MTTGAQEILFETALRAEGERLGVPGAGRLGPVALRLHHALVHAEAAAARARVGALLDRLHDAQAAERRRLSRNLHDHVAHDIGVAQRDLELSEIYRQTDPRRALARAGEARRRLADALESVRRAIGDLRIVEPAASLEHALSTFLERCADPGLTWRVEVRGDEACAPPATIEEVFVIVRESLRNVLLHATAARVEVHVDVTPERLRASVVDDGRGFDPDGTRSGGTGLLSMRERAALLGGSMTFASRRMPSRMRSGVG